MAAKQIDERFWHPTRTEWKWYCEVHEECDPRYLMMKKDGTAIVVWMKDLDRDELERGRIAYEDRRERERQEKEALKEEERLRQAEELERTQEEMHQSMLKRERRRQTVLHQKETLPERSRVQSKKQALKRKAVTTDDPFEASVLNAVDKDKRSSNANYIIHARRLSELPRIALSDPGEIRERVDFYYQLCVTDGVRPNLPGYALAFGLTRTGLMNALSDRRMTRECADEIGRGIAMMDEIVSAMALDGKINPVATIYFMNNWLGYKNASEVTTRTEQVETSVDQKALEQKYNTVIDME